ncbi:MAG TPA: tetratricopeptide repeat protein [Polyangiaceae bacterium]|jgi:hypothetical protein
MRRLLAAAVVALAVSTPAGARAQTKEDVARADALFNAAKALTDSGQYTDACAKFAESKRLAPGLGVTLYLADCYEHIGRTASAWTEFRSAEGLARERNDKRADVARAHAQALEPKLDRLTITVAPTVPQAGLQVLRDGVPVTQEELGLPVPVDPGDHAVVVSSPGHASRTFTAHVGPESPTATVRVDSLDEATTAPLPPASSSAAPPPTESATVPPPVDLPPAQPDDSGRTTRRYVGLGIGALGIVGIGVGSVFGVIAKIKLDQSNNGPCDPTDHCTTDGLSQRKDDERTATISNIAFVAGGVLLAAGIVLYVTAPKPQPTTGVVVAPAPMAGGGGAMLRASF